jgi:hypothetical protein
MRLAGIDVARVIPRRAGRPPVPDELVLRVAVIYDGIAKTNPRPIPAVARQLRLTAPKVRRLVYLARERDYLSRATDQQGRHGGELTPTAYKRLEELRSAAPKPTKR